MGSLAASRWAKLVTSSLWSRFWVGWWSGRKKMLPGPDWKQNGRNFKTNKFPILGAECWKKTELSKTYLKLAASNWQRVTSAGVSLLFSLEPCEAVANYKQAIVQMRVHVVLEKQLESGLWTDGAPREPKTTMFTRKTIGLGHTMPRRHYVSKPMQMLSL